MNPNKIYKGEHVVLKKGAELINVTKGENYRVEFEESLEGVLKKAGETGYSDAIDVERTDSKNISFKIGPTEYMVRKREYLVLETKEDRLRREAKVAKRVKRQEVREARRIAKGEPLNPKKEDDDDIEIVEDVESVGRDMYQIMEQYGDDVEKYPKKLQKIVRNGIKLKERLDRLEERFAKRFYRMHKAELKKYYGNGYKEENYGLVFQTVLEL